MGQSISSFERFTRNQAAAIAEHGPIEYHWKLFKDQDGLLTCAAVLSLRGECGWMQMGIFSHCLEHQLRISSSSTLMHRNVPEDLICPLLMQSAIGESGDAFRQGQCIGWQTPALRG
jgi:hypothetical protein